MCFKCHHSYKPEDNTNWACQIHPSEWGGQLWWCCGKNSIKAPGCKRARHMTREEQDKMETQEDVIDSEEENKKKALAVCYACK